MWKKKALKHFFFLDPQKVFSIPSFSLFELYFISFYGQKSVKSLSRNGNWLLINTKKANNVSREWAQASIFLLYSWIYVWFFFCSLFLYVQGLTFMLIFQVYAFYCFYSVPFVSSKYCWGDTFFSDSFNKNSRKNTFWS